MPSFRAQGNASVSSFLMTPLSWTISYRQPKLLLCINFLPSLVIVDVPIGISFCFSSFWLNEFLLELDYDVWCCDGCAHETPTMPSGTSSWTNLKKFLVKQRQPPWGACFRPKFWWMYQHRHWSRFWFHCTLQSIHINLQFPPWSCQLFQPIPRSFTHLGNYHQCNLPVCLRICFTGPAWLSASRIMTEMFRRSGLGKDVAYLAASEDSQPFSVGVRDMVVGR